MQLCMCTIIIFMMYLILVESTGSEDKKAHTTLVSLDSKAKRKLFRDQLKTLSTKKTNEPQPISENLPSRVNPGRFNGHLTRPSRPQLASEEINHKGHGSLDSKATRKIFRHQLKTFTTTQTNKRQRISENLPSRVHSGGLHEHLTGSSGPQLASDLRSQPNFGEFHEQLTGPSKPQVASDLRPHPNFGEFHELLTGSSRPQVASDLASHPNFGEFHELLTRSYRPQPPSDLTSPFRFGGYHTADNPSNIESIRLSGPSQPGHHQHDPNNPPHPPQSPPGSSLPPLPESYFDNIPRTLEHGHNWHGK